MNNCEIEDAIETYADDTKVPTDAVRFMWVLYAEMREYQGRLEELRKWSEERAREAK